MKTKEIARKFGIDQDKFELFLQQKQLSYEKGLFSSLSVNDADVDSYVRSFNEFQAEQVRKRKAEEEAKRKAAEEAKRKAEEEAKRKAAEEEARRKIEVQQRVERIRFAEEEYLKRTEEEKNNFNFETVEGRNEFMANCVKLYKEKLKGTWNQNGASYDNGDILGLWLTSLTYTEDGEVQTATNRTTGNFNYSVYLSGDESGRCMLYVKGNPNGFCSTLGEITFTEDNNNFTLNCRSSCFFFSRA